MYLITEGKTINKLRRGTVPINAEVGTNTNLPLRVRICLTYRSIGINVEENKNW